MADLVFKYPGAKTQLCSWILDHVADHRTWVDVFGGSGVVTANKPESSVEVYNDMDGDLVHFFTTLRDKPDELAEWLINTPHSRELHRKYGKHYYQGLRPKDDIERAGRFFYLRFTQWGTKYNGFSGYNGARKRNSVDSYHAAVSRLTKWADRFRGVQIEQVDFAEVIDRYDGADTLLYCDPPYMDEGDALYSHSEDFDHERFVKTLLATEGDWIVSYTRVPAALRENAEVIISKEHKVSIDQNQHEETKSNTERLVMSYDPEQTNLFSPQQQYKLGESMQ